ncbi:MAG: hypothetical protein APF76_16465 [Desulfitibacter sp. BRH_c19]|nr:MAG: hypothetical protein APF76_16465 [Desulfitibacter sp. BRH_c19]
MEWIKAKNLYDSEEKALKVANIISTTEARLASQARGAQYEVETKVENVGGKWQIIWRKVFTGHKSGCSGGCNSCHETPAKQAKAKIIPFKKPSD